MTLPIRQMVLYKHGVGFFSREGETSASRVTLTFRTDEINDVLKSIVAFDRNQAGQVLGIHYETPMDKEARQREGSIHLPTNASLVGLLRDLSGREVALTFQIKRARSGPARRIVEGRLVGVDLPDDEKLEPMVSVIVRKSDEVQTFPIRTLRAVRIVDDRARHDLHYFLDTTMSEETRRSVTIRLSEGDHNLVVYYVAPSPTWRVSYRIIAETGEDGGGEALIQGWGLFDNRLDEDLENVSVTLVAGQPISFIYDLYASRIPERPVIEDESRVAPGPVEYKAERRARPAARRAPSGQTASFRAAAAAPAPEADALQDLEMAFKEGAGSLSAQAEGREAGEFFQYVVTNPVSVKRGDSAMVPILSTDISYSKELLYNGSKLPEHPVAALRFENTTGLTLERGPVTVVEDGEYVGESVVPFTKTDNDVYLPYAVELGIQVTERHSNRREMAGLGIRQDYLLLQEYQITNTTYIIENTTGRDHTVTLERIIKPQMELFNTPEPNVETAEERRWRISVPAHDSVEFAVNERRMLQSTEQIRRLNYRQLQRYLQDRWLDQETFEQLSTVLDGLAAIQAARAEMEALKGERGEIYERQGQLRENLGALGTEGDEAALRARMLRQLESTEDRIEAIEARLVDLDEFITTTEETIEQTIAALAQE